MDISTVSTCSSPRGILQNSPSLQRTLSKKNNKYVIKKSILWTFVNFLLIALILYDLSFACSLRSYYDYFEYCLVLIISINILYYFTQILSVSFTHDEQKQPEKLLHDSISQKYIKNNSDLTNMSWFSFNSSMHSPSWKGTPHFKLEKNDITDETTLDEFLKEREKLNKQPSPQSNNLLSSFWRQPLTNNDSFVLSKCKYHLSPAFNRNQQNSIEDSVTSSEEWTKINVNTVALTQWNENLRKWISQTILERLVHEIDNVNKCLENHGLNDVCLGEIGLERLRKTAYTVPVVTLIPSLKMLIRFLEITPNQEYLIGRLRQLARGGCMSDFKWNSGGNYNGKQWNDTLPTDCAIIMNSLATYLDIQLMPLPSAPDIKPFSGFHFIRFGEKFPKSTGIFIHEVSEHPPHYRVIMGERTYEMGKGYNNLFHSILFFLYFVNKIGHGMIGRVNLGKAGVNMLWIINQEQ